MRIIMIISTEINKTKLKVSRNACLKLLLQKQKQQQKTVRINTLWLKLNEKLKISIKVLSLIIYLEMKSMNKIHLNNLWIILLILNSTQLSLNFVSYIQVMARLHLNASNIEYTYFKKYIDIMYLVSTCLSLPWIISDILRHDSETVGQWD